MLLLFFFLVLFCLLMKTSMCSHKFIFNALNNVFGFCHFHTFIYWFLASFFFILRLYILQFICIYMFIWSIAVCCMLLLHLIKFTMEIAPFNFITKIIYVYIHIYLFKYFIKWIINFFQLMEFMWNYKCMEIVCVCVCICVSVCVFEANVFHFHVLTIWLFCTSILHTFQFAEGIRTFLWKCIIFAFYFQ